MSSDLRGLTRLGVEANINISYNQMRIGMSSGVADFATITVNLKTDDTEIETRKYWDEYSRKLVNGVLSANELAALEIMKEWIEGFISGEEVKIYYI